MVASAGYLQEDIFEGWLMYFNISDLNAALAQA
jgi:hypothetical protein